MIPPVLIFFPARARYDTAPAYLYSVRVHLYFVRARLYSARARLHSVHACSEFSEHESFTSAPAAQMSVPVEYT
jgi:hypothetical protein